MCLAQFSRGLVGRMMADPAFLQKMLMEQAITVGSSVWWEAEQRGDRFSSELDLVAINTLSLCAANAALVWMVSSDRSFGAPHKMPWQKLLHSLPNNMFDRCAAPGPCALPFRLPHCTHMSAPL